MISIATKMQRNELNRSPNRKYYGGKATQKKTRRNKQKLQRLKVPKYKHEEMDEYDEEIIDKLSKELDSGSMKLNHLSWFNNSYFHCQNLKYLLSITEQKYLNKHVIITYFDEDKAILKGRLTLI